MISKRQAIDHIVSGSIHDEKLILQLKRSQEIRSFASSDLALPDNDSYSSFVQLDHPYIVWNVFAASEFSTQLVQWCYFIIGCVSYRGYFDQQDANEYALGLKEKGLDVYIAGVPAYSTLGWFADPLLSSMLDRGEVITASYIFHELAHQLFYVEDDSAYNEAFATAVEELGVTKWLESQSMHKELKAYQSWLDQKRIFLNFIKQKRNEFEKIYEKEIDDEAKRLLKSDKINQIRLAFEKLSDEHEQLKRYVKWMAGPLNNAQFGVIALYHDRVPDFKNLFTLCQQDFKRFYKQVQELSELNKEKREKALKEIKACD